MTDLATDACPKHMQYGPCGGVGFEGSCEIASHRCVFVDVETVRWRDGRADAAAPPAPTTSADRMRRLLGTRPVVVADFPARALDADSIAQSAAVLRGSVDAVLAGDSGRAREQFPPAYRAHLIRASGLEVWSGLNCRDRNRVALEGELAALAHAGAAAVHCVTGDHTATGSRPDAMPVFDLDSTRLVTLARAAGHLVSVGESPATPPTDKRAARLVEKVRAGAEVCFVNHAGGVSPVAGFVAEVQALGAEPAFVACVPVILDTASAELLASFTSLVLPPGYLDGILGATGVRGAGVRAAGIRAAVDLGRRLLDVPGVVGVNLSGGGEPGDELAFAEGLAEIAASVTR